MVFPLQKSLVSHKFALPKAYDISLQSCTKLQQIL